MDKLKKKLQYWFDNRMSKGASAMIVMLAAITVIVVILIVGVIQAVEPGEDGIIANAWDVASTVINAWMPYSEEGGLGYLIPTAAAAIFGLLFTSVLISIVSTAIEEKIDSLKKGNSIVVEEGHMVVIGFESGSYEILSQLIEYAGDDKLVIVAAGEGEKDEMEADIRENLDIPKNVKLICRSVDIDSAASMACCSIETAEAVIVSTYDDMRTVKSVLAVSRLLQEHPEAQTRIIAAVTNDDYMLPASLSAAHNITMIHTGEVIARLIAHSCSQSGISQTFMDVLNFEGEELYVSTNKEAWGRTFGELYQIMDGGVPIGILRGEDIRLCIDPEEKLDEGDRLVYMAGERNGYTLSDRPTQKLQMGRTSELTSLEAGNILIFGYNDQIDTLLAELPEGENRVIFAGTGDEINQRISAMAGSYPNVKIGFNTGDPFSEEVLEKATEDVDHVILLNNYESNKDDSDVRSIVAYTKLVDIRRRLNRGYNITMELFYENNRDLALSSSDTDFVVANNMSAMIVSQLAVSPRLRYVYRELLSNEGVEIRLITPSEDELGSILTSELRKKTMKDGMILLGYIHADGEASETVLNPGLDETVELDDSSRLIVIG